MLLLGDVLGTISMILGICLTAWAVIVGYAGLFPKRTEFAMAKLDDRPVKSIVVGLVVWLIIGSLAVVMISLPLQLIKLFGIVVLMALIGVTCVGLSGLSRLLGKRFHAMDSNMSDWQSLNRGTAVTILSCMLPLVGWFAILPLVLAAGMGAGLSALRARIETPAPSFELGS